MDIELVEPILKPRPPQFLDKMRAVKGFLQSVGIIYVDWKPDNIGLGMDGELKLFDFNGSGTYSIETNQWLLEPPHFYYYRTSPVKTPLELDDWAFENEWVMAV